jgi:hypothetical protein
VPPISGINSEATPEVDSILKRALARNASHRYQSARALALDLTRCLYRFGRPVDAFALAELVRGPMMMRQRSQEDGSSIIDKLIQETLFECTSLKAEEEKATSNDLSRPFQMGGFDFEDFGRLADAARGTQAAQLVRNTLPSNIFEDGNLAALEGPDEPLPDLADRLTPEPLRPEPQGAVPSAPEPGPELGPPESLGEAEIPTTSSSALLKVLLAALVATGTLAALWFSGLL